MAYPYQARALLKYKPPPGASTFGFQKGDTLTVLEAADDDGDWLKGFVTGHDALEGVFPSSFVEPLPDDAPAPAPAPVGAEEVEDAPLQAPIEDAVIATPPAPLPSPPATAPSNALPVPETVPAAPPAVLPVASEPVSSPAPSAKPQSLRDRIAALNAAGAGAAPPPPTKPKPSFARKPWAPPPAAHSTYVPAAVHPPQPHTSVSPPLPPVAAVPVAPQPAASTHPGFSAEDAQASSTLSLKERIKALQTQNLALENTLTPTALPGRAPKPPAWKVKVPAKDGEDGDEEEAVYEKVESISPEPPTTSMEDAGPPAQKASDEVSTTVPTPAEEPAASSSPASPPPALTMAMAPLPKRAGPPRRTKATPPAAPPPELPTVVTPPPEAQDSPAAPEDVVVDSPPQSEKVQDGEEEPPVINDKAKVAMASAAAIASAAMLARAGRTMSSESEPEPAQVLSTEQTLSYESDVDAEPEVLVDGDPSPPLPPTSPPPPPHRAALIPKIGSDQPEPHPHAELEPESDHDEVEDQEDEAEAAVASEKVGREPVAEEPGPDSYAPVPVDGGILEEVEAVGASTEEEHEVVSPSLHPPRPSIPPIPTSFVPGQAFSSPKAPVVIPHSTHPDDDYKVDNYQDQKPIPPLPRSRPSVPPIPTAFAPTHVIPHPKPSIVIPHSSELLEDDNDAAVPAPSSPATKARPAVPGVPGSFKMQHGHASSEEHVTRSRSKSPGSDSERVPRRSMSLASESVAALRQSISLASEQEEDEGELETKEVSNEGTPAVEEEDEAEPVAEDPEIARRRALAARMAKLGGMSMRPMMPPIGGMRKPVKKSSDSSVEAPTREASTEVEPPNRQPGFPSGGVLLPGMMPRAAPPPVPIDEPAESEVREQSPAEEAAAPPPLPHGRPSSQGPPRRSIPVPPPVVAEFEPESEEQKDDDEDADSDGEEYKAPPPLPAGRPSMSPHRPPTRFVAEPEQVENESNELIVDDEEDLPPPPPPSRAAIPSSSVSSSSGLSRRVTGEGALLGVAIPRGSFDLGGRGSMDSQREDFSLRPQVSKSSSVGTGPPDGFKARDIDLTLGSRWWRTLPFSPPMSIKGRKDAIYEVSPASMTKRGKTKHDNEIEVIYDDLSKSLIAISFIEGEDSEASTTTTQTHFPPPPTPSISELVQLSDTLGSQIAHAADAVVGSRLAVDALIPTVFAAVSNPEPLPPIGATFGIRIFKQSIDVKSSKAKPALKETDEPRPGDVAVLSETKFKSGLLSKNRSGAGGDQPLVGVVKSWDAKKRKMVLVEVGHQGVVEEASYKLEELKAGSVNVFRVVDRAILDLD